MPQRRLEFNVEMLDKLTRALKQRLPIARVGVLGSHAIRKNANGSDLTNADVGAIQEFGSFSRGIRSRSFLRTPLKDHLNEKLNKDKNLGEASLKEVIRTGNVKIWMLRIAAVAEAIVLEAFATSGFGKWAQWKPGYTNQTGQILIDSQQLVKSISSEVK